MPVSHPLVPWTLTICGLSELAQHAQADVSHVCTILDPDWPDPEDFLVYGPHSRVTFRFHDIINEREGWDAPEEAHIQAVLELGESLKQAQVTHLLIHCHMGISRSTASAAILLAQDNPGREMEVFDLIHDLRPKSWPNSRMIAMADRALGRRGALVEAMAIHHARVAKAFPAFAADLALGERANEIPGS